MFITKTNLPIFVKMLKVVKGKSRTRAHIIDRKEDTFCYCTRLTRKAHYLILGSNKELLNKMIELEIVCDHCIKRYRRCHPSE